MNTRLFILANAVLLATPQFANKQPVVPKVQSFSFFRQDGMRVHRSIVNAKRIYTEPEAIDEFEAILKRHAEESRRQANRK